MNPPIESYVKERIAELELIPDSRRQELAEVTQHIQTQVDAGKPVQLTFICTHNSRRSHFGRVWAQVAAAHYGILNVTTFSGGTEATAINLRAIAALKRVGFTVSSNEAEPNPRYEVRFSETASAMECFSKVYNQSPNPTTNYCAILVCTDADQKCPIVTGATKRLALPYEDPKIADNTDQEAAKYDERCAQIAREMLFTLANVNIVSR